MYENEDEGIFKKCTSCGFVWEELEDFVSDPMLTIVGYQAFLSDNILGLFLFNHEVCKTTLASGADLFQKIYNGPLYTQNLHGQAECPDYCMTTYNLEPCPLECECAYVREIIQAIKKWPKKQEGKPAK